MTQYEAMMILVAVAVITISIYKFAREFKCEICGSRIIIDHGDANSLLCKRCSNSEAGIKLMDERKRRIVLQELLVTSESQQEPETSFETHPKSSGMRAGHISSIVIGVLLLVTGIILLTIRHDLAIKWIGRDLVLREALLGGNSLQNALTVIISGSIITLVAGILFLIFGLVLGIRNR